MKTSQRAAGDLEIFVKSIRTSFGLVKVLWSVRRGRPWVTGILLPRGDKRPRRAPRSLTGHGPSCPPIDKLGDRIIRFLHGENEALPLTLIDFGRCSRFQRRVLLAEHRIPRGKVSTYGRIAESLGVRGGARAVGRALATNPFPLVIPCHRTVRGDGELGGFQGGIDMKRRLLAMEGVRFDVKGRVRAEYML